MRTTMAAVIVVGAALALAATAMVVLLRRSLTEATRDRAEARAEAIADRIDEGLPPDLSVDDPEEEFVQVIDASGRVVAASENAGDRRLVDLAPDESTTDVRFDDEPFVAVAVAVDDDEPRSGTVVVGEDIEAVVESGSVVTGLLVAGIPVLLLIVGVVTWRVVGRALAPVESIRREVETLTGAELDRRVPVPASGDEIARLATTMNAMLERLEASRARERRFVSDASHELRSPVASIRAHAEVALAHPGGASATELARVVLDEDLRIQRLVEDLLLLARMDEHASDGHRKVVDLDDIVFEEVGRARVGTDKTVDTAQVSAGRVVGDRSQLARMTANVLDNAVRHARATVAVTLREDGDDVRLSIDDDGAGIPPGELRRVFERFVRLQEARDRDSGGSGLGLAIVAEVARAHGGRAEAMASPLGGARIEVRLPRAAG